VQSLTLPCRLRTTPGTRARRLCTRACPLTSLSRFKPEEENIQGGVCLRVEPGRFRGFPYENHFLQPFEAAVKILNPVIAVKLRSASVNAAISSV
jgi:hypothetical protein